MRGDIAGLRTNQEAATEALAHIDQITLGEKVEVVKVAEKEEPAMAAPVAPQ